MKRRVWSMSVNATAAHKQYDDKEITVVEFAGVIAAKIRGLPPYQAKDEGLDYSELERIEHQFAHEVSDIEDFDDALGALYDWGDSYNCWITFQG